MTNGNSSSWSNDAYNDNNLAFGMLIGVGSATSISIKLGQGREEAEKYNRKCNFFISNNRYFNNSNRNIILKRYLKVFGASDATLVYAKAYISIILFGSVFNILGMMFNNIIRGDGNPKLSAIIMAVGCGTNIVLGTFYIWI